MIDSVFKTGVLILFLSGSCPIQSAAGTVSMVAEAAPIVFKNCRLRNFIGILSLHWGLIKK